MAYMLIFLLKMWVALQSYSHFFSKNTCELDIVLIRTVNSLTTIELVKLMTLWTTGPWLKTWLTNLGEFSRHMSRSSAFPARLHMRHWRHWWACAFAQSDQSSQGTLWAKKRLQAENEIQANAVQANNLGPVVQSIVSLMISSVVKMLTVLGSTISNSQVFLLKKMQMQIQSYSHFIQQKY